MPYSGQPTRNPISQSFDTSHASAIVTLGALAILWLIGRGFRGVAIGGVSVGVK